MVAELTLIPVRQMAPPVSLPQLPHPGVQGKENSGSGGKSTPPPQQSGQPASQEDVLEAVHRMRDYMQIIDRDLHFSVDEDSGITVVKVIDPATDEVVRQIPCEEVMRVARSLEQGGGLLSETKV